MFIVPAHVFNPEPVQADVVSRVISGGTALNGDEDVIATDGGGRWEISWGEIDLDTVYQRRLWGAWSSHLSGGAQPVLVPLLSLDTAPRPIAGNGLATPSDIYANDDWFPTEVRFASPLIQAVVVSVADLRATTLTILVTQGAPVQPGVRFSIGNRAYKVVRVTARDRHIATCIISPPLRNAVEAGAAVNFNWPVVQARSVIGQSLAQSVSFGSFATVSVNFVEDFSDAD